LVRIAKPLGHIDATHRHLIAYNIFRFKLYVEEIPHMKIEFFLKTVSASVTGRSFYGHDSRGDREINAFHRFNGATEVEGSVVVA
jgi:hypothetical protein